MAVAIKERKIMLHPHWYYKNYSKIFSRGGGYEQEINQIKSLVELKGLMIQEIGAGTGEHASLILRESPSTLELIDNDPEAIKILKHRFINQNNVIIRQTDGFISQESFYDLIICMYSVIIQNIEEFDSLRNRIQILLKRLRHFGKLIFEFVDSEVSKEIYPEGITTEIYRDGKDYITIGSSYTDKTTVIFYKGIMEGKKISYSVPLLSISADKIGAIIRSLGCNRYILIPLDEYCRRLLVYLGVSSKI